MFTPFASPFTPKRGQSGAAGGIRRGSAPGTRGRGHVAGGGHRAAGFRGRFGRGGGRGGRGGAGAEGFPVQQRQQQQQQQQQQQYSGVPGGVGFPIEGPTNSFSIGNGGAVLQGPPAAQAGLLSSNTTDPAIVPPPPPFGAGLLQPAAIFPGAPTASQPGRGHHVLPAPRSQQPFAAAGAVLGGGPPPVTPAPAPLSVNVGFGGVVPQAPRGPPGGVLSGGKGALQPLTAGLSTGPAPSVPFASPFAPAARVAKAAPPSRDTSANAGQPKPTDPFTSQGTAVFAAVAESTSAPPSAPASGHHVDRSVGAAAAQGGSQASVFPTASSGAPASAVAPASAFGKSVFSAAPSWTAKAGSVHGTTASSLKTPVNGRESSAQQNLPVHRAEQAEGDDGEEEEEEMGSAEDGEERTEKDDDDDDDGDHDDDRDGAVDGQDTETGSVEFSVDEEDDFGSDVYDELGSQDGHENARNPPTATVSAFAAAPARAPAQPQAPVRTGTAGSTTAAPPQLKSVPGAFSAAFGSPQGAGAFETRAFASSAARGEGQSHASASIFSGQPATAASPPAEDDLRRRAARFGAAAAQPSSSRPPEQRCSPNSAAATTTRMSTASFPPREPQRVTGGNTWESSRADALPPRHRGQPVDLSKMTYAGQRFASFLAKVADEHSREGAWEDMHGGFYGSDVLDGERGMHADFSHATDELLAVWEREKARHRSLQGAEMRGEMWVALFALGCRLNQLRSAVKHAEAGEPCEAGELQGVRDHLDDALTDACAYANQINDITLEVFQHETAMLAPYSILPTVLRVVRNTFDHANLHGVFRVQSNMRTVTSKLFSVLLKKLKASVVEPHGAPAAGHAHAAPRWTLLCKSGRDHQLVMAFAALVYEIRVSDGPYSDDLKHFVDAFHVCFPSALEERCMLYYSEANQYLQLPLTPDSLRAASQLLASAIATLPPSSGDPDGDAVEENRSVLLLKLAAVQLALGRTPRPHDGELASLAALDDSIAALRSGDLHLFDRALQNHGIFFLETGIYNVMMAARERVSLLLVVKYYLARNCSTQINVDDLVRYYGFDYSVEEAMAIWLLPLLVKAQINGLLDQQTLIMSSTNPFEGYSKQQLLSKAVSEYGFVDSAAA